MTPPRWTPSPERVANAAVTAFTEVARRRSGLPIPDYEALHAWSVADRHAFWGLYATWSGLLDHAPERVHSDDPLPAVRWFEETRCNYAEALLLPSGAQLDGDLEALVAIDEEGHRLTLTRADLVAEVGRTQAALLREGIGAGDRVAALAGNGLEAVVALLACAGIGAVFTSCSPDFGLEAARARFAQVAPRLLLASPASRYGGRRFAIDGVARALADELGVARLVWLPVPGEAELEPLDARERAWSGWRDAAAEPIFEPLPFDHPLYVLYSSGTTGRPKAIVHCAGGALLTHHKEHRLHCDIGPGDRVMFYTTLGWMMWNWLVSALAQGATVVLYDGSPAHPDALALWRLAERERLTFLGCGARFLHTLDAEGVRPNDEVDLTALRTVASTGSALAPSGFRYVYEAVKPDVHLASISGGTDIVGCFMLGVPTLPVHDGQIQRPGLGVDLAVFDEQGREVEEGPGELVCRSPLPSMPLGFWGDDGSRIGEAYFDRFPGVWRHGDRIERTAEGGIVVHGRSDATLNPGGVRIGTAEIYAPLEAIPEVVDACAVARRTPGDEEVWLLLVLADDAVLDVALEERVRAAIRRGASPRHVPRRILAVRDLPRTRSGKAMELAVRAIVNGESVANRDVMANPESCDEIARAVAAVT
jgi:acetoacetyl-CoA synthetase